MQQIPKLATWSHRDGPNMPTKVRVRAFSPVPKDVTERAVALECRWVIVAPDVADLASTWQPGDQALGWISAFES